MVSGIGADPPGEWQVVHRVERIARISRAKVIFVVIGSCAAGCAAAAISSRRAAADAKRPAFCLLPSTLWITVRPRDAP